LSGVTLFVQRVESGPSADFHVAVSFADTQQQQVNKRKKKTVYRGMKNEAICINTPSKN
jgi:hypothetical protein